jgi:serine/threonine protein kinase
MLDVYDMYDAPQLTGYDVTGLLGSGGDAQVWVAVERASGRRVALKALRTRDSAQRQRLHREAALQAGIAHPHVLRVLAVHDSPAALVLILELAEGGSLHDLIVKRGALPPGEVVTACAPIAQALAAVHERGVVHGDVSCANVLFTSDGRPLLADLGVARIAGELPSEVGLTRGFTAPELLTGGVPGPAADVFSLAVSVRTALIGVMPDDPRAAIIKSPPLPAAAIRIIERAFSGEPRARPTAAELADALFRLAAPRPLNLPRPAPLPAVPTAPPDRPTHRVARRSGGDNDEGPTYVGRRAKKSPAKNPAKDDEPPRIAGTSPESQQSAAHAGPGSTAVAPAMPRRQQRIPAPAGPAAARETATAPTTTIGDLPAIAPETHRRRRPPQGPPPESPAPPKPRERGRRRGKPAPDLDGSAGGLRAANRRRDLARLATYIVVPALLVGAVLLGWQWANSDEESADTLSAVRPQGVGKAAASAICGGPAPAPTAQPPAPEDWAVVVRELNNARSEAFAKGDPSMLCKVYVPTSETLQADLELMNLYDRRGVRAQGFQFQVESVTLVSQEAGRVILEITDALPPYPLVDDEGKERATQPGKPKLTWRAELLPAPDGSSWRYG